MHESVIVYRKYRYLKWALVLSIAAVVVYSFHSPIGVPNGGTWLGYTLGVIGAGLIVWLMWFGVKKRTYGAGRVKLEDWLSAHVYLGLSLIVVATLHSGFQFGWNVHTLAYALMMAVILSGTFGLYAYIRYPKLMSENRRGSTLESMMIDIAELDRECREVTLDLSDDMRDEILRSSENTRIGGSVWRQLTGTDPHCTTTAALERIREMARHVQPEQTVTARKLLILLGRKLELVRQARVDVQFKAILDVWLYLHVPASFALLAALVAHIIVVFFYR